MSLSILWLVATAGLAAPAFPTEELQAGVDVGATNYHAKDEHYLPRIHRGWLPTLAGGLVLQRPHGRHALTFGYAAGSLRATGDGQPARQQLATLTYLFEHAVSTGALFARPFQVRVGGGLRTLAENTEFRTDPRLGAPFESYLWSHALLGRLTTAWLPGAGVRLACAVDAAIGSRVARPPYGQPEPDFWGAAFAGRLRAPWSAPQVTAELFGRAPLYGPLGLRAGLHVWAFSAPDPYPLRAFGHFLFLGIDGSR